MLKKGNLLTAHNMNLAYLSKNSNASQTITGPVTFLGAITGNSSTATKLATGRTISLTGNVTGVSPVFDGSGNISFTTTIASNAITTARINNSAVTYAKIQNVTANRILGRLSSTGVAQELTAANVRGLINVADGADNYNHWKLYTAGALRANIGSGSIVNLKAGSNVTISYSATNNTVTISSSFTNTNTATAVDNILDGSNSGTAITYAPYTTNLSATGNRFYTHSSLPTATTLLNLSSHLRITQGTVNGSLEVVGDIIGNAKAAIRTSDAWLRINPDSNFTNGIYSPKGIRADGGLSAGNYTLSSNEVRADIFRGANSSYYVRPANTTTSGLFAGKIGIGTTSPSDPLHVVGNMRFTGTLQAGTVPWARISEAPTTATRWPSWGEVTGKPSTFAPSTHTHAWVQVTDPPAQATRWPNWAEVTGKPTTFAPATHTHSNISITAGNGLSGGGTLAANRTITLGTPGTLNASTSNEVTSTSHTHNVTGFLPLTGGTLTHASFGSALTISRNHASNASAITYRNNSGVLGRAGFATNGFILYFGENTSSPDWQISSSATLTSGTVPWARISGAPATATAHPTWAQVTGKPSTFAPATHTHSYLPLSGGTLTGTLTVNSNLTSSGVISCSQTSGTAGGISLYSGASSVTSYGLAFRKTANQGTHGYVTGDWATYLFMSGSNTRGWVFKHGSTNVASISGLGYLSAARVYNAVYNDYAEYFLKDSQDIEAGDIIMKNPNGKGYIKSQEENSKLVIGVMSTEYAQCIGGDKGVSPEEQEIKFAPVGLAGRVPVKVTGKINQGDLIVSSNIPGVGMASQGYIPGTIVGKALENYNSKKVGKIEMLIMNI